MWDSGTRRHGDSGTWGLGDAGMQGHGDPGTWGRKHMGHEHTRGLEDVGRRDWMNVLNKQHVPDFCTEFVKYNFRRSNEK